MLIKHKTFLMKWNQLVYGCCLCVSVAAAGADITFLCLPLISPSLSFFQSLICPLTLSFCLSLSLSLTFVLNSTLLASFSLSVAPSLYFASSLSTFCSYFLYLCHPVALLLPTSLYGKLVSFSYSSSLVQMSTLHVTAIGIKSVKMSKSIQPNYIENHYFHKLLILHF